MPDEYVRIGMSMKSSSSAKSTISSYFSAQLRAREAGGQAAEHHVLAPGQLAVEADAERQQRAHAAVDLDPPAGRRQDAGDRAHERRLAGAVGADHAQHLAVRDLERDVPERLDLADDPLAPAQPQQRALERRVALERRAVGDRHVLDADPRRGSEADSELTLPGDEEQRAADEERERPGGAERRGRPGRARAPKSMHVAPRGQQRRERVERRAGTGSGPAPRRRSRGSATRTATSAARR